MDTTNTTMNESGATQPQEQMIANAKNRLGPKNLSKKYNIDRDDFYAVFERLTRFILNNYNFGSEMVTIAFLDLLRNGDIPEPSQEEKPAGIYRR